MKRSLLCLLATFFYTVLLSQKDCRQDDYQSQLFTLHPQLRVQYEKVETFGRSHSFNIVNGRVAGTDSAGSVPAFVVPEKIIIPVVVHVLWNSHAQNISDAQILSQIDVLNKDYGGLNADRNKVPAYFSALTAGCGLSFALAKTDPQGHPTSGIVRKQTSVSVFSFDDKAKSAATYGDDAWNADDYLNIWVCNLENGISGYASVPGGPKETDGVVISTAVFGTLNISGPFNKGRTATHEIGHWLNLRHLWGDANCGDDKVDDTPTQQAANRGCNSGEKFTCGSTAHGDMYMNYMDFSDDACMFMFTNGQRARMRVLFESGGVRNSLLFSGALNGSGLPVQDTLPGTVGEASLLLYPNPAANIITLQLKRNINTAGNKIYICNYLGQIVKTVSCVSNQQQINISTLQPGLYFLRVDGMQSKAMIKFIKE
jgi:hypothetical protein